MKTLYLHIGMPKTATSSLQAFIKNNQDLLCSYGFSYRVSPYDYAPKSIRRNAYFLNGPGTNHDLSEGKENQYQERLRGGLSFFHEQFSECENVIATDEHLWYSVQYGQWDILQTLLDDGADNDYSVKVIVYLRRQDGYLLSNWNQNVKKRGINETFSQYRNRILSKFPLLVNYDQALDQIASKIGEENIIVRRFQSDAWVGGSIYTDFLDALGLDPALPLKAPEHWVNSSFPYNFTELQRLINCNHFLSDSDKKRLSGTLKKTAADSPDNHNLSPLTAKETASLLEGFREGNERAAKKYIGDGKPLFDGEIHETKKWTMDNEYFLGDAERFLSELSEKDRRLYVSSMIFEQQKSLSDLQAQTDKRGNKNRKTENESSQLSKISDRVRRIFH